MGTDAGERLAGLLRRLLDGDAAAWGELVRDYSPFLLAVSRRTFASYGIRPTGQDIEDAAADVWKNLLEHDRRIVRDCLARGNFLQTLQVLARNRSVDLMRKRQARAVPLQETHAVSEPPPEGPADGITPEEVARAAESLTPRERVLIRLFFLQGKKYREIAAITGIPQNSIGPTLARALARLREALRGD